ncbi:MAG: HAD-IA family hydrolase [Kouleothrix sp.]|jgi:HAD superfamily hydrolase (TIGR01509 family)|nr:HAD-IA family hydrolase [Kouleothrix sp.]
MQTEHAPRAVLWDMDGTLLDSAEYHWLAWQATMAGEQFDLTYAQFVASFGQRNDTILRGWLGAGLAEHEIARIGAAKEQRYRELVRDRGVVLLPGVEHWLRRLQAGGWRQAIASAAPHLNVAAILDTLQIGPFFDAITSAEDVQHGKPDPQVFLLAAARVATPPARCIVVEDAPAGIEGAHRGGMRAIGVRSAHSDLRADIVVGTLAELDDDAFERLLAGQ